jgi:transcriptional regulator with XRE-family HTH domain
MPVASTNAFGDGLSMKPLSQIVTSNASPIFHNLCGAIGITECDIVRMATDKNGGPNYLKAWREFRGLTQAELAEKLDTNANMIGYLESGERGLSAKWLRKLAPALDTTPGLLLDHDPAELDSDIIDIWAHADRRQKAQLSEIAKTLTRTGTSG